MKRSILYCVILISTLICFESCKKDTENNENKTIIFDGITTTDNTGFLTGFYDSTDWSKDDNWVDIEKELFTDFNKFNYECLMDSLVEIIAYPNPFDDMVIIHIDGDSTTRIDYRIVNKEFGIIVSQDSIYNTQIAFTFKDTDTQPDEIFRVYYRIVVENDCAFIGHGDIQIK